MSEVWLWVIGLLIYLSLMIAEDVRSKSTSVHRKRVILLEKHSSSYLTSQAKRFCVLLVRFSFCRYDLQLFFRRPFPWFVSSSWRNVPRAIWPVKRNGSSYCWYVFFCRLGLQVQMVVGPSNGVKYQVRTRCTSPRSAPFSVRSYCTLFLFHPCFSLFRLDFTLWWFALSSLTHSLSLSLEFYVAFICSRCAA